MGICVLNMTYILIYTRPVADPELRSGGCTKLIDKLYMQPRGWVWENINCLRQETDRGKGRNLPYSFSIMINDLLKELNGNVIGFRIDMNLLVTVLAFGDEYLYNNIFLTFPL